MSRSRVRTLRVGAPFELGVALHGHGWVALAPNAFDPGSGRWRTVLQGGGRPFDVEVWQTNAETLGMRIDPEPDRAELATLRRAIRHMLRLEEDFEPFWTLCRSVPRLSWVARRGAGRLLRSPTLFEDLMKLLFTTNCSWSLTKHMTTRLVQALGPVASNGRRGFPSAEVCAAESEGFFKDEVRAGYRARSAFRLATSFAEGALEDAAFFDPEVPTDVLRKRLRALPGFGPYAAGQALRLLGRYDDLALDSYCRAKLAEMEKRTRPRTDRSIERAYAAHGAYAGLVLWMDLTRAWHEGRESDMRRVFVIERSG